jgi:putative transposase
MIQHRQIPITAQVKQIIVTRSKSDKWYACVTCDIDAVLPKINFAKSVGIDVGITNFVYDSEGHKTSNPLNLQKMLRPLARAQRKISRRRKGSKNRKKSIRWYRIIHERIANRRKDFLHKLSNQYTKYDVVFVERLAKLNMLKNHKLSRKILDSGWGIFVNMLDYKCKMLVEVSPNNTTVDCSRCGTAIPKSLGIRTHLCHVCGLMLDRDYNASINILKRGLEIFQTKLPQKLREDTPVEIAKQSMKQEEAIGFVQ